MTPSTINLFKKSTTITWEKLPDDFILPDEPVDNNLQPLLAAALRESLELAGLILESMLIASNFGLCATVKTQTVVKAPDWVYIPSVKPIADHIFSLGKFSGIVKVLDSVNIEGRGRLYMYIIFEYLIQHK